MSSRTLWHWYVLLDFYLDSLFINNDEKNDARMSYSVFLKLFWFLFIKYYFNIIYVWNENDNSSHVMGFFLLTAPCNVSMMYHGILIIKLYHRSFRYVKTAYNGDVPNFGKKSVESSTKIETICLWRFINL